MKKVLFSVFVLLLPIALGWAAVLKYKVFSPLAGELGSIELETTQKDGRYRIKAEASTKGLAAMLTGNRREKYLSEGRVEGGKFVSEHFRIERRMKKKREIVDYRFDHTARKIYKNKIRWEKGRMQKNVTKILKYYSCVDLAALYANEIPEILSSSEGAGQYNVVGAEKIGGVVKILRASPQREKRELQRLDMKRGEVIIVTSDKKIFGKRGRELIFVIDTDSTLQKAWLQAMPMVGNIYIERLK
jgi:hypothetical protein